MSLWSNTDSARPGRRRLAHIALWIALPLLGLAYQIAAKEMASSLGDLAFGRDWLVRAAASPWIWAMVVLEVISFVAWMIVLAEMKLSVAFPLSAAGYVLVIAAGWVVFREPANALQVIGGGLILAGLWLIGRGKGEAASC